MSNLLFFSGLSLHFLFPAWVHQLVITKFRHRINVLISPQGCLLILFWKNRGSVGKKIGVPVWFSSHTRLLTRLWICSLKHITHHPSCYARHRARRFSSCCCKWPSDTTRPQSDVLFFLIIVFFSSSGRNPRTYIQSRYESSIMGVRVFRCRCSSGRCDWVPIRWFDDPVDEVSSKLVLRQPNTTTLSNSYSCSR